MFRVCLCLTVVFVPCSLVVACLERVDLLALLAVVVPCVVATFPYDVLGQMWYFIATIPDLCLLPYLILVDKEKYQFYV